MVHGFQAHGVELGFEAKMADATLELERFWKYLRQKIINTTFYRTKGQFRTAVLDFFTRLPEFGPDLASLLTRKFHILDAQPTS